MFSGPDVAWRKSARCSLSWRDWGGDSVVFDARSGHTHQFAPLTAAVMAHLEVRPRSSIELVAAIAADLDCDVDSALREGVQSIVQQLGRLGWIEALPHP